MRGRGVVGFVLGVVGLVACGQAPEVAPPRTSSAADVAPIAGCTDAVFQDLCARADGDAFPGIPSHHEVACGAGPDHGALFAPIEGALPGDFEAFQGLCGLMDPAPHTNDVDKPEVREKIRETFATIAERPAMKRALARGEGKGKSAVDRMTDAWLRTGAFEHVFCGESNGNGTVGGQHLWSRVYLEERAGRIAYTCSREGLSDADVATVTYTWAPAKLGARIEKPVGGFHVGMSPACLVALGVAAHEHACPSSEGVRTAFRSRIYGANVDWVYWTKPDGGMVTLFPLADDAKGARRP
jgi:hypothetical protein